MQQFFLLICCCQEIDTQILVAIYLRARPRGLSFVACTVHLLQLILLIYAGLCLVAGIFRLRK